MAISVASGALVIGYFDGVSDYLTRNPSSFDITRLDNGRVVLITPQDYANTPDDAFLAHGLHVLQSNNTILSSQFFATNGTDLDYGLPSLTFGANGNFAANWSFLEGPAPNNNIDVALRFYNTTGTAISSATSPSTSQGDLTSKLEEELHGSTVYLGNGNYLATWTDSRATPWDNADFDVMGRIYNAAGTPVGGEFVVANGTGPQFKPVTASLPDGRAIVVYLSATSTDATLMARFVNSAGAPTGSPFAITSVPISTSVVFGTVEVDPPGIVHHEVVALGNGSFAVVWDDGVSISFQRFTASGAVAGPQTIVAESIFDDTSVTYVSGLKTVELSNGGFAVIWQNTTEDIYFSGETHVRIFGMDGSEIGSEEILRFEIPDTTGPGPRYNGVNQIVDATLMSNGRVMALGIFADAYLIGEDVSGQDQIRTQIFDFGDERLLGTSQADTLYGRRGVNDTILAGDGNDTIRGLGGSDYFAGGQGNDSYLTDGGDTIVELSGAGSGTDTVFSTVSYTIGANLENLSLSGAAAINGTGNAVNNVLNGSTNSAANTLTGLGGDDTYIVGTGDRVVEAANGGTDNVQSAISYTLTLHTERLHLIGTSAISGTGNAQNNIIDGSGNSAANTLSGLSGNDTYIVGTGDRVVEAVGGGTDTVQSAVSHTLATYVENLTLTGAAAISGAGNAGNNFINGSTNSAANTLSGLGGNDTYVVGTGDRVVEAAGGGTDTIQSSTVSINLASTANVEIVTLTGNASLNVTGNDQVNTLNGNSGNNILSGLGGNDLLNGGLGMDTLIGGAGRDVFLFNTAVSSSNIDRIQQFNWRDDLIQVDDAVIPRTANGFFVYNSSNGSLSYDSNGTAAGGLLQFATVISDGSPFEVGRVVFV